MQPFSNTNNWKNVIKKAIKDLAQNFENKSFDKSELAYLALTSKIENPLRDRIAFNIYNQIGDNYLVCREWKGNSKKEGNRHATDLAIVKSDSKDNIPIVLIEFKAHSVPGYSENEYTKHMKKDLEFLKIKAENLTELYYILFTTLPEGEEELMTEIDQSVKYFYKINRSIEKKYNLISEINDTWKVHLKNNKMQNKSNETIKISGGEYHGHKISVIAQVLGPLKKAELSDL